MTVLVVGAHADDETLGAGGTLARIAATGRPVSWLVLSEGCSSRPQSGDDLEARRTARAEECARAAALLGVSDITQLDLPDNRFDQLDLLDIVRLVEEQISRAGPSLVLTHHHGDLNVDHRITHQAVLAATRPLPASPVRTVLGFEVLSSTGWTFARDDAFVPTVFVDISETIEQKIAAVEAYWSELRPFPHPRSPESVRALAAVRGATTGAVAAEAFELIRAVR